MAHTPTLCIPAALRRSRRNRVWPATLRGGLLLALAAGLFSGCVGNKKIVLLQDQQARIPWDTVVDTAWAPQAPTFTLKAGDMLMVHMDQTRIVKDLAPQTSMEDRDLYRSVEHPYLIGHSIAPDGTITLPGLGAIMVDGLSIPEAEQAIKQQADLSYSDATVKVVLLNFTISVVGEVNRPGRYPVYDNRMNVLEGLALANDLTVLADRSRIRIVRSREGTNHLYHLDLTDQHLLADPHFYLQPGDVIIVDPLKRRQFTGRDPNLVINILTFLVSIIGVYAALNR